MTITVVAAGKGDGNLLVRDNSSQLCTDCHALQTHSSQTAGNTYGSWSTTCRDCHQPHRTRNAYLVREVIAPPAVSAYQGWKSVTFYNTTGDAANSFVNSSATYPNGPMGPCQACHTRTKSSGGAARWRNTGNADTHYTAAAGTQACTNCHKHDSGFGAAETSGRVDCTSCHNAIFTAMNSTTVGHHHFLYQGWSGTTANSNTTVYPTTVPTSSQTDVNRRCLMCHVDHDLFRPDLNASGGRGKNLRTDIALTPTATTNFTNRDFDSALTNGGICVSCHTNSLTRSFADATAGTVTMAVTKADFQASAHTFSGAGTTATFGGTLTNTFVGDCGKCHDDTTTKSYQTGYRQAVHDSTIRSILAPVGIASPTDPLAEKLCYQCHRQTTDTVSGRTNKPAANRDYFNLVPMLLRPRAAAVRPRVRRLHAGLRPRRRESGGPAALEYLARLYWYTEEFVLVRTAAGLRIYGAGILSSPSEVSYALSSPLPKRIGFGVERVMRTRYKIDTFQQTYFVIDDFGQLFRETEPYFTPLYQRIAGLDPYPADTLLPQDQTFEPVEV